MTKPFKIAVITFGFLLVTVSGLIYWQAQATVTYDLSKVRPSYGFSDPFGEKELVVFDCGFSPMDVCDVIEYPPRSYFVMLHIRLCLLWLMCLSFIIIGYRYGRPSRAEQVVFPAAFFVLFGITLYYAIILFY